MKKVDLAEMLKTGMHFGHRTSKRHPKMMPYVFTNRNNISIIDLEKTREKLNEACQFIRSVVASGGTVLFVNTKKQARDVFEKHVAECKMPYVVERWLGGVLTNYGVVSKTFAKLEKFEKDEESGDLLKYTKKEQLKLKKEYDKLEKIVGGLRRMNGLPQAMFVVDLKHEQTAVREAQKKNIPIVSMADTNVNPEKVDYPIPANDDALKSIEYIILVITEAVKEGQAEAEKNKLVASVELEKKEEPKDQEVKK